APRTRSMTKTLFDSLELKKMSPFMRTFSQSVYRVTISQADNSSASVRLSDKGSYDIMKPRCFPKDEEGMCFMLTAEFFWKLFEATGSVAAYLLYRKYLLQ
ncbi:MAG: YqzL family protein, partial [Bacillota bacterium]